MTKTRKLSSCSENIMSEIGNKSNASLEKVMEDKNTSEIFRSHSGSCHSVHDVWPLGGRMDQVRCMSSET